MSPSRNVEDEVVRSAMDVGAYLSRIGYAGAVRPTIEALGAMHRAHSTSIPFENVDIQRGLPIDLDVAALEDKLVARRRGGYCFEHNTLAYHALAAIGFDVTPCEARVRLGATRVAPRTHMVLLVNIPRSAGPKVRRSEDSTGCWLWDTGFGGDTPLEPLPLDGTTVEQGGALYRVVNEDGLFVVAMNGGERWGDLYAFVPESREPIDFIVGNWYTSTHPDSHFVSTLTAQQRTPTGSKVLRNLLYTVTTGGCATSEEIRRDEVVPFLKREFGLDLPEDTRFRALDSRG